MQKHLPLDDDMNCDLLSKYVASSRQAGCGRVFNRRKFNRDWENVEACEVYFKDVTEFLRLKNWVRCIRDRGGEAIVV